MFQAKNTLFAFTSVCISRDINVIPFFAGSISFFQHARDIVGQYPDFAYPSNGFRILGFYARWNSGRVIKFLIKVFFSLVNAAAGYNWYS